MEMRGALPSPCCTSIFKYGDSTSVQGSELGTHPERPILWQVARSSVAPLPSPHSWFSCSPCSASALASALRTLRLLAPPALGTLLGRVGNRGVYTHFGAGHSGTGLGYREKGGH